MSPSGWTPTRLGELVEIKHGWPFKSEHFDQTLTGGPIVVSIGNFRYTGGFRFEETAIKEYRDNYPKEYELTPGEILLVMTCQTAGGEILGIPARVPNDGRIYLHNQRLGKVAIRDSTRVATDYLYWLFLWQDFNRELVTSASGTKILHTAPSRIEEFSFNLPPLSEQRAIAYILGTLDDKIELNRRMSETLGAMARALFKSWFVDFDPVRAKAEGRDPGLPREIADLFPDAFEVSELGEIPKGWEASTVGDHIVNFDSKRIPVSGSERAERQGPYPYHGAAGVMDYVDDYLFQGVHLLIGEDGSVVQESGLAVSQYVWGRFWVNNHAHVLQGKGAVSTEQLYLYFHFEPVAPYVTGAVQPKLSQGRMNLMPFVFAGDLVCRAFADAVQPWFARLRANEEEARTLATLRNALLPKLLSGKLQVPNLTYIAGSHKP